MKTPEIYHPTAEEQNWLGCPEEVGLYYDDKRKLYWFACLRGAAILRDDKSAVAYCEE